MGKVKAYYTDMQEEMYLEACSDRDFYKSAHEDAVKKCKELEIELQAYKDDEYHIVGRSDHRGDVV